MNLADRTVCESRTVPPWDVQDILGTNLQIQYGYGAGVFLLYKAGLSLVPRHLRGGGQEGGP